MISNSLHVLTTNEHTVKTSVLVVNTQLGLMQASITIATQVTFGIMYTVVIALVSV